MHYVTRMSSMIQIRNVPPDLHRKMKARAALEGKSLSEYLLAELRRLAELPTRRNGARALRRASRFP